MFRLYDYQATGRIPKHLAVKLVKGLGFDFGSSGLGKEVSLKELLLWLDQRCAERFPVLNWYDNIYIILMTIIIIIITTSIGH